MKPSFRIAQKDLRQRLRDRSAIMLGVLAPLGLAAIFSLIIPDTATDFSVALGVVDEDRGPISTVFVDEVLGSLEAEGLFETTRLASEDAAFAATEAGEVDSAIIVPAGFSEAVASAEPGTCGNDGCVAAAISVVGHVDRQTSAQISDAVATAFSGNLTAVRVAAATAATLGADAQEATMLASQAAPQITVVDVTTESKQLSLSTFFAAGMAIFFLFFTVQFGVSSLLEERTNGTMPRLLAAPIAWWQIVAGKGIASFVVGVVATTVLIVASTLMFGADWGHPIGVAVLVICAVLSAIGIMAVIATLARTPEQAANWQAIVAVVLGMLGGTFFPVSQAPGILSQLSLLTPHAWFMRGLGELTNDGAAVNVLPAALALLTVFVVTTTIAASRMKRMVLA